MERLKAILARLCAVTAITLSLVNCGGGGSSSSSTPPPPPGTLAGIVADASLTPKAPISGASVTVFDANTNTAVKTLFTSTTGQYRTDLVPGSYFIRVAKQGFDPAPPLALEPVPFSITSSTTTTNDIELYPVTNTGIGWISGRVMQGNVGVPGVLVVATSGNSAYSALSDTTGNYSIYNVPVAADYSVTGHRAGYTATTATPVTVSQSIATTNVTITLSPNAVGQVPVSFNVISQTGVTPPARMLVALIHPLTHEAIPGLAQNLPYSPSISFLLGGVADGSYLVRATYANDTIVVDPDAIVKFGEPSVVVSAGSATPNPVDIKATSAVALVSPTNAMTTPAPVLVSATPAPTFTWSAYPSTSDYVVEVMDATTGAVVWGGFSNNGTVKNVSTAGTTIAYGGPELIVGHVYRWRVYASKNDNTTLGWHLISASEDQQGLIKIQ